MSWYAPVIHPVPVAPTPPRPTDGPVRRCLRCKAHHPVEDFGRLKSAPGGLNYYCKPCDRQRQNEANARRRARLALWREERKA